MESNEIKIIEKKIEKIINSTIDRINKEMPFIILNNKPSLNDNIDLAINNTKMNLYVDIIDNVLKLEFNHWLNNELKSYIKDYISLIFFENKEHSFLYLEPLAKEIYFHS